jgi:hypothetical protein
MRISEVRVYYFRRETDEKDYSEQIAVIWGNQESSKELDNDRLKKIRESLQNIKRDL